MRLTEFIQQHRSKIIDEWVKFAGTLLPWAKDMTEKDLRDHSEELLAAIVVDMDAPQSGKEQADKSKGRAADGALSSVGHKHATERLKTGLTLNQLVAEYRALRASVLRLWEASTSTNNEKHDEVTRFNEAIDETLTEAAAWYSEEMNQTREQFIAILGHDLRNPLSMILMGAEILVESQGDGQDATMAKRILDSAGRMNRMVHDLLDLTRTRLGAGIPITPKPMDLTPVCNQVVSDFAIIRPGCRLGFESKGDLHGEWDTDRLHQVVTNLVANAVQYGPAGGPVSVVAEESGQEVILRVHNGGVPIPEEAMRKIFDPMFRRSGQDGKNTTGLGLGLYIAREVVTAHGGTIEVTSTEEDGTTFTVKVPRHAKPKDGRTSGLEAKV